jgi:hypothetical protein
VILNINFKLDVGSEGKNQTTDNVLVKKIEDRILILLQLMVCGVDLKLVIAANKTSCLTCAGKLFIWLPP